MGKLTLAGYICFDALKQGWRIGYRRIINLDECFFKGMCTGQLLCAVGRDGTNHIYLTAWAIVCVENKDNWKWFLENLQEDLHHEGGFGRTLMSDQHKVCFYFIMSYLISFKCDIILNIMMI